MGSVETDRHYGNYAQYIGLIWIFILF